jgi:hypothetical protein
MSNWASLLQGDGNLLLSGTLCSITLPHSWLFNETFLNSWLPRGSGAVFAFDRSADFQCICAIGSAGSSV